ncbi:potassium channel family protein [Paenibacillus sp. CCS19]|uniref:potassium channel family protein n=1 Tax=Paenibacillus sp. CCS19 TaxID=3158387 RepID=UPI00295E8DC6|nr:potassium channel family protein [Paenibacillus cellulosilyticus]
MLSFILTLKRMLTGLFHAFKEKNFRTLFVTTLIMLLSGTMFYHGKENFSYIDSLYFCVMTLTTVGGSGLVPATTFGKIFTMIYTLAGIGIIFGFIFYVGRGIHFSSSAKPKRSDKAEYDEEEDKEAQPQ